MRRKKVVSQSWVWKQIPILEGGGGQEQGHVPWAIHCLFCCPAWSYFKGGKASLGKSFFQMCAITGSISVATDQAIFSINSQLPVIVFDDSAFRILLSFLLPPWLDGIGGRHRAVHFGFKCCHDPQENNSCCTNGCTKGAMALCQAKDCTSSAQMSCGQFSAIWSSKPLFGPWQQVFSF